MDDIEVNRMALFDHVKRSKRGGQVSPPINDLGGNSLRSDKAKAEAFQEKFMGVFQEHEYVKHEWSMGATLVDLDLNPVKLRKRLGRMKRGSAPGIDTLGPALYKESPFVVFEALSHLYQFCLDNDQLPIEWMIVKVIPLWKNSGSKADINKYRPVSLGSTAWKLFEAMYLDGINKLSEDQEAYGKNQHGFRAKHSTVTNLTEYWDHVTKSMDKGKRVHVLNLDMSSAFDTVNIDGILDGLERIGLGGNLGRLLEAWLKNRFQYVELNGEKSSIGRVNSGVQQGSLTGPALFNLATSRLTSRLEAAGVRTWKYADDLKAVFTIDNHIDHQQVQDGIDHLVKAASEAGLKFNSAKSTLMSFGRKKDPFEFEFHIDGEAIPRVQEACDLGVVFQSNLNFGSTLARNLKKSLAIVHIIRATIKVRSFDLLNKIYQSYFLPIITYGSEIFTSEKATVKKVMHKGYRAFWRLGGGRMHIDNKILDPFQVCILKELMFFKRVQMEKTCLNFGELFSFADTQGTRAFQNHDLKTVGTTRCPRYNFFSNVCTRLYNDLDPAKRNLGTLGSFKAEVLRMINDKFPTPNYDLSPKMRV